MRQEIAIEGRIYVKDGRRWRVASAKPDGSIAFYVVDVSISPPNPLAPRPASRAARALGHGATGKPKNRPSAADAILERLRWYLNRTNVQDIQAVQWIRNVQKRRIILNLPNIQIFQY